MHENYFLYRISWNFFGVMLYHATKTGSHHIGFWYNEIYISEYSTLFFNQKKNHHLFKYFLMIHFWSKTPMKWCNLWTKANKGRTERNGVNNSAVWSTTENFLLRKQFYWPKKWQKMSHKNYNLTQQNPKKIC